MLVVGVHAPAVLSADSVGKPKADPYPVFSSTLAAWCRRDTTSMTAPATPSSVWCPLRQFQRAQSGGGCARERCAANLTNDAFSSSQRRKTIRHVLQTAWILGFPVPAEDSKAPKRVTVALCRVLSPIDCIPKGASTGAELCGKDVRCACVVPLRATGAPGRRRYLSVADILEL